MKLSTTLINGTLSWMAIMVAVFGLAACGGANFAGNKKVQAVNANNNPDDEVDYADQNDDDGFTMDNSGDIQPNLEQDCENAGGNWDGRQCVTCGYNERFDEVSQQCINFDYAQGGNTDNGQGIQTTAAIISMGLPMITSLINSLPPPSSGGGGGLHTLWLSVKPVTNNKVPIGLRLGMTNPTPAPGRGCCNLAHVCTKA